MTNTSTHPEKCIGHVTLDIKRLYQCMPKHLQKKVSLHDLKLICDAYNGDQPPVDNQFVADRCEKFGHLPEESVWEKHGLSEPTIEGVTMDEWYNGFSKIESTEPEPRCEAGMLFNHQCKNKATLVTSSGYKCCKYHAPCISKGKWRDDVVPLSEKTTQVSDKKPAPEWRELGPDEVIQDGDEVQWKGGAWGKAQSSIGCKAGYWEGNKVARTRRPLPNDSESPKSSKQEEMPLAKEEFLSVFNYHLCLCEDAGESDDLLQCLRYLRDEIQKLKEAK